nr:P42 [Shallot virus X]
MVIVTTFHIDAARDRIIDSINATRNTVTNHIVPISNRLGNVEVLFQNFRTEVIQRLTLIADRTSSIEDLEVETTSNLTTLLNCFAGTENQTQTSSRQNINEGRAFPNVQRIFFSSLDTALNATQALLSHVPPARYTLPPAPLPVDELFGQLHALHLNTLEWLTHISHNTDSILDMLNPANLLSQGTPLSRLRDAALTLTQAAGTIQSDQQAILSSISSTSQSELLLRLEAIDANLRQLSATLDGIASSLDNASGQPPTTIPDTPNSSAIPGSAALPLYQAVHPNIFCRTYGVIRYNGIDSRIPMDVTGRPASTSLKLTVTAECNEQHTMINFTLLDDGCILLSDSIDTKHRLQHVPSDYLSLIHAKCPRFIYKFRDEGLC